jgi:hypothetical protein
MSTSVTTQDPGPSLAAAATLAEDKRAERRPGPLSTEERKARAFEWRFEEAERLTALAPAQRLLYTDLWVFRGRRSLEEAVPAYRILTNRQLLGIAEALPVSGEALLAVTGISRPRFDFVPEVLALVRARTAGGLRGC